MFCYFDYITIIIDFTINPNLLKLARTAAALQYVISLP